MRRASSKILSHLPPSSSILSRIFHSQFQPLQTKIIGNESDSSKSKTIFFSKISQNKLCTLAEEIPPQMSNLEKEHMKKAALADAFKATTSTEYMIACFKKWEEVFDESELGMACLKLGVRLDGEGEDPEKATRINFSTTQLSSSKSQDLLLNFIEEEKEGRRRK